MAKPRPVFVFDNPRTYSHVFGKIFSAHPDLEYIYHPYLLTGTHSPERIQLGLQHNAAAQAADAGLVKIWESWPPEMKASYAAITAAVLGQVDEAEQKGKRAFLKEHILFMLKREVIHTTLDQDSRSEPVGWTKNPTWFPESVLASSQPIILIRHPAQTWYSNYRLNRQWLKYEPDEPWCKCLSSLMWARLLYDYLCSLGTEPIIVNAEDIIYNTEVLVESLCNKLNLDHAGVRFSWPVVPVEERPPGAAGAFRETIDSSTGIVRPHGQTKPSRIEMAAEVLRWEAEFGHETAARLQRAVEADMANYNYLYDRKVEIAGAVGVEIKP